VDTAASKSFHLPALDGIRALSIAIVFVSHAGAGHLVPGGFGVTTFFFLSGFLISTLLRREFDKTNSISFQHFYIRRALRILPPFYAALMLAVVMLYFGLLPGSVDWGGVAALAAHLGNYVQIYWPNLSMPRGTGVYWSLAVEEHYYLTFPIIALMLLRLRSRLLTAVTLTLIAFAILAWRIYLVHHGAPEDRTFYATDTRLDSILWGCILALALNPAMDRIPSTSRSTEVAILCAALAVLLFCIIYRDQAFRETYRYTLQGIALLPVFYFAVLRTHWPVFRWLDWPPVRYIGTLSYTLYLVHQVVLSSLEYVFPATSVPVRGLTGAAISICLAALSYRYMERPLASLRKRYN
jgi:peptidoglycan/LPS O-acetylase OafA/YrhL